MSRDETGTPMFDPAAHVRQLKQRSGGTADYLDVRWRLVWLRDQHPDADLRTELIEHSPGDYALFKCTVSIPTDLDPFYATGYGMETQQDFRDYLEKAETKAIGRALAHAGFGTQFIPTDTAVVDTPVGVSGGSVNGDGGDGMATPEQVEAIRRLWREAYPDLALATRLKADWQVDESSQLSEYQAGNFIKALSKERRKEGLTISGGR